MQANHLTVAVAIISLAGQGAAIAWYGGRLEQQVATQQKSIDAHAQEIKELRRDIGNQSNAIAATNVAYADIIRRLETIDRKIDRR